MENNVFKGHLIRKAIVGGAFAVLAIGAAVANASGKAAQMPQIKNISFFSSQPLTIAQETVAA